MPILDLYGRNPDVASTTFAYPYPLVGDTPVLPGSRFITKPPESNPVFGVSGDWAPDVEDTTVLIDPGNPYYRSHPGGLSGLRGATQLGGISGISGITPRRLGAAMASDLGQSGDGWQWDDRVRKAFAQEASVRATKRSDAKEGVLSFVDGVGGFYRRSSGGAQAAMAIVGALIVWNLFARRR